MFIYRILGVLPSPWEDFFCQSGGGPSVSIGEFQEDIQDDSMEISAGRMFLMEGPDEDGWYDVAVHELNVDTAKLVLAKINGVSSAEIEIIQEGVCISV